MRPPLRQPISVCRGKLRCVFTNNTTYLVDQRFPNCDTLPIFKDPNQVDTVKSIHNRVRLDKQIEVFPNPASSKIAFDTKNQRIADVSVYNALGNLMKRDALLTNEMDVSDLEDGLYTLVVTYIDGNRVKSRLMIMR